ncbi:hypothetical protein [Flavobacterium hungaricum]|uniref:Lipoprotein n=1 Tax=Flavobacterium hungaricum TaxID=2082725 RepID=A0ABR9TDD1_9FLAO|nr:hypothetical protein [Flavobacterium hungaricum]MBE8723362.1 hypothetical protein [Flavobacterium hungaricum]
MEKREVYETNSKIYSNVLLKVAIVLVLLVSCSKQKINNPNLKWIMDKYGCKGYRTIELAKSIVSKNQMINNCRESDFIQTFGDADLVEGNFLSKELFYLSQSNCEGSELVINSDKCYIVFSFEYGYLKSINEMCE